MDKKGLLLKIAAALMVFAGLMIWQKRYVILAEHFRHQFLSQSPEARIELYEKAISEDQRILSNFAIFSPSHGSRDAGGYLNRIFRNIRPSGKLDRKNLPSRWMKQALRFDTWSSDQESDAYASALDWSKVRLEEARKSTDSLQALMEVRHLARLLWTQDDLLSALFAVQLLRLEHDYPHPKWQRIPLDAIERAKRYVFFVPEIADIRLPDDQFERLTNGTIGFCLMAVEGLKNLMAMRELHGAGNPDPIFVAYEKRIKKFVQATQRGRCRKTTLHKIWEDQSLRSVSAPMDLGPESIPLLGSWVMATPEQRIQRPEVRTAVRFWLELQPVPDRMVLYRREIGKR